MFYKAVPSSFRHLFILDSIVLLREAILLKTK